MVSQADHKTVGKYEESIHKIPKYKVEFNRIVDWLIEAMVVIQDNKS